MTAAPYVICIAVNLLVWLIPYRAPLWLDETVTYLQIKSGFLNIYSRQGWPGCPAYQYILWLFSKIFGTSEVALRLPSVLAMLAAVYLLYRAVRRLFDPHMGAVTVILFCVNPIVIFAAIDARPYAFAALAISGAIYLLVRLRENDSNWLAAGLGALAAVIIWFHFLFAVITPALLIGFFVVKLAARRENDLQIAHERGVVWRQLTCAAGGFVVAFLPVIPGLLYMFRTRGDHPFDRVPELGDLLATLAPGWSLPVLAGTALVALIIAGLNPGKRNAPAEGVEFWRILLCQLLAIVPLGILYVVSIATPLHIFVVRYRLVAVAGVSMCWALLVSGFKPRVLQLLFCVAMVGLTSYQYFRSPQSRHHGYTWKYAIEVAERNATRDNAPVLICSDLPESDHMPLPPPGDGAKDSNLYAPLSYYHLSAPVVPLPRSLNDEAKQIGSTFLHQAAQRRERFLSLAYMPSYPTLEWLVESASGSYDAREVGTFDGVVVLEFTPKPK